MNTKNQNKEQNNTTTIYIEAFEKLKGQKQFPEGMNATMYFAYRESQETNNEILNFYDVIWDNDIEQIVKICKANGIKEFSISSTYSGMVTCLAIFEKFGCKVRGLTEANDRRNMRGIIKTIPAIKIEVL